VLNFLNFYVFISQKNFFNIFRFLNQYDKNKNKSIFKLVLTFKSKRLYINLLNVKGVNYLSLSVGLFLKFFKNKKSLKKTKNFKLLLAKYLRKLLIISEIKNMDIYIKKTPVYLKEIFLLVTTPLPKGFFNPIVGEDLVESPEKHNPLNIRYLFFCKTKTYTDMKVARKGRLKRKINRRIINSNNIID
jgi:hypothetical protein